MEKIDFWKSYLAIFSKEPLLKEVSVRSYKGNSKETFTEVFFSLDVGIGFFRLRYDKASIFSGLNAPKLVFFLISDTPTSLGPVEYSTFNLLYKWPKNGQNPDFGKKSKFRFKTKNMVKYGSEMERTHPKRHFQTTSFWDFEKNWKNFRFFTHNLLSVLTKPIKKADTIFKNRFFPYVYMTSTEPIKIILFTN